MWKLLLGFEGLVHFLKKIKRWTNTLHLPHPPGPRCTCWHWPIKIALIQGGCWVIVHFFLGFLSMFNNFLITTYSSSKWKLKQIFKYCVKKNISNRGGREGMLCQLCSQVAGLIKVNPFTMRHHICAAAKGWALTPKRYTYVLLGSCCLRTESALIVLSSERQSCLGRLFSDHVTTVIVVTWLLILSAPQAFQTL